MPRRVKTRRRAVKPPDTPFAIEFILPNPAALQEDWNYTDRADRLYWTGHRLLERGFFVEADGLFEKATRYDRAHHLAYVGRAETLVVLGANDLAIETLQEAAHRYGRNCALGAALGHLYLHLGHSTEAFECADTAVRNDPCSAYVWLIAGETRLSVKHALRFAENCFDEARKAEDRWPRLDLRIGLAYLEWGPHSRARELLLEYSDRHPDIPLAWMLLGDANRVMGHRRDARACYQRALDLAPDLAAVRRAIGWTASLRDVWRGLGRTFKRVLST